MTYEYADGVYALNSYLTKALRINLGWEPISYTTPLGAKVSSPLIIPSQQQPELLQAGKDFLVYGSAIQPTTKPYGMYNESVFYTCWSTSNKQATQTVNFIYDLFEPDDVVNDVNLWLEAEQGLNLETGVSARRDRHISFGAIRPGMVEKAEPSEMEDGWYSSMASVRILYTKKDHRPQTSFTYP